jgi:hypothetical protein
MRLLYFALAAGLLATAYADTAVLRGEHLEAQIDPATGRLTQLSLPGGSGQILTSPGIEVRTAQQVQVRFITGSWLLPADPTLTDKPWRILRQSSRQLTVESSPSPLLGLRTSQTYEIDPKKPALHIRTTLTRTDKNPFPVQVWLIVPVPLPDFMLLETPPAWRDTRHAWTELSNPGVLNRAIVQEFSDAIRFSPPLNSPHPKIGTLGRWVAGVYRDRVVVLVTKPTHGSYPDASSVQAYAATNRAELETVSPNRHLKPSERLVSESTLWVFSRDPAVPAERLPQWIDARLKAYR